MQDLSISRPITCLRVKKGSLYVETDRPNPINVYGRSKLAGEEAVQQVGGAYIILRTSRVNRLRRECFVTQVLRWSREKQTLRIVSAQVGELTWERMLAEATAQMLEKGKTIYYIGAI